MRERSSNCVKVTLIATKTQKEAPSLCLDPFPLFDNDSPEYQVLEGNPRLEIERVQRDLMRHSILDSKFSKSFCVLMH